MATTLPDVSQTAGIPSQWDDTVSATIADLFTGDEPKPLIVDMIVAASQTIPALTPVGLDGSGRIVKAVQGSVAAIGITVHAITTDASTTYKGAKIYRAGVFNPARLNWDASHNTDALKFNAFNGAPSPTQIVIRAVKQYTI